MRTLPRKYCEYSKIMDDLDEFFESLGTGTIESSELGSDGVSSTDIIGDDELDELFQLSEQLSTKKAPRNDVEVAETVEKSSDLSSPNVDNSTSASDTHDAEGDGDDDSDDNDDEDRDVDGDGVRDRDEDDADT